MANVLALNAGSSSLKGMLFAVRTPHARKPGNPTWEGSLHWLTLPGPAEFRTSNPLGQDVRSVRMESANQAAETMLRSLAESNTIDAVGHRVVHGGTLSATAFITATVSAAIRRATRFAPEHNGAALAAMRAVKVHLGNVPQVAVFDSAFHSTLLPEVAMYPGPFAWYERFGFRRRGFHGISHRYCGERTTQLLGSRPSRLRVVSCHLGSGCSLAAIDRGRSVDTTMGFTPMEGLVMGSRSGSIDPGLLLYLQARFRMTPARLNRVLNEESGLKGMSGISGDIRDVIKARERGHARSALAVSVYIHHLRAAIAAMAAAMGGLDAIAFTGGVGEHVAGVRSAVCDGLQFLGVQIDEQRNAVVFGDAVISRARSAVGVSVVKAREEWSIAQETFALLYRADREG